MENATSSASNLPNDFICPVCKDVLQTPVRTSNCQHVFCRKCLVTATRIRGAVCPLCRGVVSDKDKFTPDKASDVEGEMKRLSGSCMYCTKKIKFFYMRNHYKHCKQYREEFGMLPKEATVKDDYLPLLPLYVCPVCQWENLSRKDLLEHCNNEHSSEVFEVVCPICAILPWGDPTFKSANIVAHINKRHRFNHEDFMNIHVAEEEQYRAAIENSTLI